MSLNDWELQALDSIKSEITGSDPDLAALLSAFTRLSSGEEMPNRETVPARSRRALRRFRRARRAVRARGACKRLRSPRVVLLFLWVLATAGLIAGTVVLGASSGHGSACTDMVALTCASPASGHSSDPPTHGAATSQPPQQEPANIQQAGP